MRLYEVISNFDFSFNCALNTRIRAMIRILLAQIKDSTLHDLTKTMEPGG